MKKTYYILLLSIFTLIQINLFSQTTTIHFPHFKFAKTPYLQIEKIERSDTATILHFYYYMPWNPNWIKINPTSYIQVNNDSFRLYLKGTKGVPVRCGEKWNLNDTTPLRFALIYPPIAKDADKIDYIENERSDWKIFEIELQEKAHLLPAEIAGNWLNANNQLQWVIGFHKEAAIYNNQIWHYNKISKKNDKEWVVLLEKDNELIKLNVQLLPKCMIKISTKGVPSVNCLNTIPYSAYALQPSQMSSDAAAVADNKRAIIKIYVSDIVNAKPAKLTVKTAFGSFESAVNTDGFYQFDIPMYFPLSVSLSRSYGYNLSKAFLTSFYVTPGSSNILYIDKSSTFSYKGKKLIYIKSKEDFPNAVFMGTNAHINNLMTCLEPDFNRFMSRYFLNDSVALSSPFVYRKKAKYIHDDLVAKVLKLDSLKIINKSELTILKRAISARFAFTLLSFNQHSDWYWGINKHNSNPRKSNIVKSISIYSDTGYKKALIDAFADSAFLYNVNNEVLFTHFFLNNKNFSRPTPGVVSFIEQMRDKGIQLTTQEANLYDWLKLVEDEQKGHINLELQKVLQEFKKKYQGELNAFNNAITAKSEVAYLQEQFQLPDWGHDYLLLQTMLSKIVNIENITKIYLANEIQQFKDATFTKMLLEQVAMNATKKPIEGSVFASLQNSTNEDLLQAIIQRHRGKILVVSMSSFVGIQEKDMQEKRIREQFKNDPVVFVDLIKTGKNEETIKALLKQTPGYHYTISDMEAFDLMKKFDNLSKFQFVIINQSGEWLKEYKISSYNQKDLCNLLEEMVKKPRDK